MRIVTSEIQDYFASLQMRLGEAKYVPFKAVSVGDWQPKPSDCHNNVDYWIDSRNNCARVRGWLTWGEDEHGSCHFIAHSVIEDNGVLYDITPIDPNTPPPNFLEDVGETKAFDAMQPTWSWTTYPIIVELSHEPAECGDDTEQ
jgi:hypothetical protein